MKIVIVIGSLEYGGSERQVVEFVRATHPDHASCVVVCLGDEGAQADAVRAVGARVIALGLRRVRPMGVLRLARTLRAERPDAVYGFLFWGYTLALPLARIVAPGARRVAARRSLPDTDLPSRKWGIWLRHVADACSHRVIANSEAVAAAWTERYPRLTGRMHVVGNGMRFPEDRQPAPPRESLHVVCVANLIDYKGHDTLLRAFARLDEDGAPWHASLIGEGPERERLERQARELGLDGRVTFAGRSTDVPGVLRAADLAVLPSYTEGLPNALLEAMAHGLPVVGTAVGGVPELLASGSGLVVPPRDPEALADALARMLRDERLRASAGKRGRELVRQRFSIEMMRDRTLAVLTAPMPEALKTVYPEVK